MSFLYTYKYPYIVEYVLLCTVHVPAVFDFRVLCSLCAVLNVHVYLNICPAMETWCHVFFTMLSFPNLQSVFKCCQKLLTLPLDPFDKSWIGKKILKSWIKELIEKLPFVRELKRSIKKRVCQIKFLPHILILLLYSYKFITSFGNNVNDDIELIRVWKIFSDSLLTLIYEMLRRIVEQIYIIKAIIQKFRKLKNNEVMVHGIIYVFNCTSLYFFSVPRGLWLCTCME